jgi:alkylation response protein AidB-like acyl-CoA dehydrogenase
MVLSAPGAERMLVPLADKEGLDLWLVDAPADGLRIASRHLIDRTRQFGDVTFDSTPATLIGRLSKPAASEANARLALLLAAESLGLARRMLAMTVEYVGQRVQFGVPVGSFQAVKHSAAEAFVDIEAAHSGVYYGAWALQEREPDGVMTAWIAKAFATEMAARTADRALMLHGAIGYTWEHDLQIYYKRAKLNLELFGSPKLYRERIAASLLHVETTSN